MTSSSFKRHAAALLAAACAALALPLTAGASTDVATPAAGVCAPDATGTVATDKDKYFNFETVQIIGGGYAPDCEVNVEVERPDGTVVKGDGSGAEGGDRVTTAADGTLSSTYQLADIDGLYYVRVTDVTTGAVLATTSFYDNPDLRALYEGTSATGAPKTTFNVGDTIYADGVVDGNRHYRWVVYDEDGHAVWSTACSDRTVSGRPTVVGVTYTIPGSAEPTGFWGDWTFELRQYGSNDDNCTGWGFGVYATDWISFEVVEGTQSISFGALADRAYGAADATLSATATSGLPVSFATGAGSTGCTVTGATLKVTGIGTCKVVASQGGNSSWDAAQSVTRQFAITPKALTGSFTAAGKTYDGTMVATITGRSLTGLVGGDAVSLAGGTAAFDDAGAEDGKTVTGTGFTLSGAKAANYTLASSTLTTTASITPKTVSGSFTAADKAYDGTTDATITGRSLVGAFQGDDVALTGGSASFDDENVGTDKTVTGSGFALDGDDQGNYELDGVETTQADITATELTGSFTAADKAYDGTTDATITGRTLSGVVGDEDVSLTGGAASFDDKNAGDDKTVTGTGFALDGTGKDNYHLASSTLTTTADISVKDVLVSFTAADKGYDGTRDATITGRSVAGVIEGEDVSATGGTALFASKDVGTDKVVDATGFALAGEDHGNYRIDGVDPTAADITAKSLTGSFTAADKVYDGSAGAEITGRSLAGVLEGEDVSLTGGSATFGDEHVGTDKTVTGSGFELGGADKGNYELDGVDTTAADITAKALTGSFTAADKIYDGSTDAEITGRSVGGALEGDDVALAGGKAAFASKTVGTDKTVAGSEFVLAGQESGNYALTDVAATTASITAKAVTGSFTAADKVEDGSRAATITGRSLSGQVAGDTVALEGGSAEFDTAEVGDRKPVTGTGFALAGGDAGNYVLAKAEPATASITARPVTATASSTQASRVSVTPLTLTGLRVSASCVTSAQLGLGKLTGGMKPLSLSYSLPRPAKVYVTIARRNPSMARTGCGTVKTVRKAATYEDLANGELTGDAGENTRRVGGARAAAAPVASMSVQKESRRGTTTIQVTPLLKKRTLRPGTYRVLAYAQDTDGTRTPIAKAIFRVVR